MTITDDVFGHIGSQVVRRFVLTNERGSKLQVISFGARVTSLLLKDARGQLVDVVLGEESLEGYLQNPWYMGCTVGRVAGRVSAAKFQLGGTTVNLTANCPPHHLHGGDEGFDKKIWDSHVSGDAVTFTHVSANGEEGYPGRLMCQVSYQLSQDDRVSIRYRALSDRPTVINLTNHCYWNLAGHGAGREAVRRHRVAIQADAFLPSDVDCMVTGEIRPIDRGSQFDFTVERELGSAMDLMAPGGAGFDHCFCVRSPDGSVRAAASAVSPDTGITLRVYTDQHGLQLYTGNFLHERAPAKQGVVYEHQGAFCMETQAFPNAVNIDTFPSVKLEPGQCYQHQCIYAFSSQATH